VTFENAEKTCLSSALKTRYPYIWIEITGSISPSIGFFSLRLWKIQRKIFREKYEKPF